MKLKSLFMSAIFICSGLAMKATNPTNGIFRLPQGAQYKQGTVIIKMKSEFRSYCSRTGISSMQLNNVLTSLNCTGVSKVFPAKEQPVAERNALGQKMVDLSLIYEAKISASVSIEKAINRLLATGMLEYAEPRYIHNLHYTPNDPNMGTQYFLTRIQAYAAWDINKGDTNVVIGIVDSGTDWDHPDLQNNIKYNYADPINGTDDDADGFIDNYRGWDMSENDNNPMVDQSNHGSHVSGCAAASTDNGVGVASPGFKCKFLPVKCANATATTTIDHGYEGIVYAADHGCDVLNCSWGGGSAGQFGQDAVTYATINMDCAVFCSAGNSSTDEAQYPAAYQYAYSIASTNTTDGKSGFSTYNVTVDMCAPGSNIYSTVYNNGYTNMSGTSMSSPVAAGAAAVVKAQFPTYNAQQVAEQLRMTADNIYGIGGNGAYIGKLGTGRINMYRALTESPKSVRMENIVTADGNDNTYVIDDTVTFTGDFVNYLAPLTNLSVAMTTTSPYVTILSGTANPGAMATLASVSNSANPFSLKINAGTPVNTKVTLTITCTDGVYTSVQYYDVFVNVDYINITINDVHTTITSKGMLYYNDGPPTQGLGFKYLGTNLAYDGALMIGNNNNVSDMVRDGGVYDNDFVSQNVVQRVNPTVSSDFDLLGKFNDNNAPAATRLKVQVTHKAFAWVSAGNRKFVIVEYNIKNTGTSALASMYAGIFTDWDVPAFGNNKADVDNTLKMGYTYSTDVGGKWAAVKLLTQGGFKNYSLDNVAGGAGGVDPTADFTAAEKYTTLSTNRAQAGVAGAGEDVCQVVSSGPFNVVAGDSVIVAFAIIAGDDLADIQTSAANAQIKYDGIVSALEQPLNNANEFALIDVFPNPAGSEANIAFVNPANEKIKVCLLDVVGKNVIDINIPANANGMQTVTVNTKALSKGIYFVQIAAGEKVITKKLVIE